MKNYKKHALKFVITMGIVSLFADITYEGARSITGAYLAVLGASAAVVGTVSGFGEFIGYALRFVSGYLVDKTHRYWLFTAVGYTLNVISVPLLAFTNTWQIAALLIILERMGKGIRIPARDAMLSQASDSIGMGWGFGLHGALDRIGAMIGPLLISVVLFFRHDYRDGFLVLAFPSLLALLALYTAYYYYPHPEQLAEKSKMDVQIPYPVFKLFLLASALVAAGYADFPLIAYHFEKTGLLRDMWIPLTYSMATGVNIVVAPFLGRLYDRYGMKVLITMIILTAFFAPLVFLGTALIAFLGAILWGIGIGGVQDVLLRSVVGQMVPAKRRASTYGIFNMVYGVCWFLGSASQGWLYDYSLIALVLFIFILQMMSIPLFILVDKKWNLLLQ